MDSLLGFEECVKDSPEFRLNLDQFEKEVSLLESHLDKVMKLCGRMVEAGQVYSSTNQLFLSSLADLSTYQETNGVVTNCLNQFNQGLQEMVSFHTMLFDQTQRAISQQLNNLCTQFLPQLAETRREFVRIGEDLETAALKNAQVSRHKASEAERASHLLLATQKCYQHFALDYCLQLNSFKIQQRADILNSVFSFVHAQFTFFHQGFDLLRDMEPTMKTMAAQLSQLSADCVSKRKDLENKHLLVQQRDASGEQMVSPCPGSDDIIQGYLFKRCRRKSKTWKRCWFTIRDNQLIYRKSHKDDTMVLFEDLRLCAVKSLEHTDRRFCFELLSVQKSCALQADSEQLKQAWLSALQGSIDLAYRERGGTPLTQPKEPPSLLCGEENPPVPPTQRPAALGVALSGPGNQRCCDCGEEEPRWASINLGVTMCIECSGIHRSLGVHLSKVRSLTLDSWEAEQLKLLCILGNDIMNGIYEARCSEEGRVKPTADSPRPEKEMWIKEKYVEKRFVQSSGSDAAQCPKVNPGHLYQAALAGDLVAMAKALAEGAEVSGCVPEEEGRTALIGAAVGGSLLACEFLLQNGANINYRDLRGQGALHAAATAGHTGQVCLLLKRGANQYAVDETGQDPLAIAVEAANADIVTLLRMARMNEEMRDSEGIFGAMGDDQTFQDIFRDFSDMASHDPEKLSRRQLIRGGDSELGEDKERDKY
ncbi:arf-GAP with coiled-coil, ANK repeat and PH domain-containing protein 2-like [Solea senegalensis]|uniref:Arf-GAP with coiled-coil, ANK repeat and PH domain-containing protein n=1 Tax=Solea senegalensis TaxID=28829 RepID=A0AAV6PV90_SOLSE|nr:BAR_ACAPs and ArfGap_ACAP domain-containing protein [Solea senegalensis]KAG7478933.1 arf-GAP with coiled-coil, ANK repeat and PH domain-containing protein 2-like [Solea senegalensis]